MVGNGEAIDEWDYQLFDENVVNRSFSKRSIAQRREEKCGFNASGISTPAMSPPPDRETFLTIPPGLTPTALLDSPVMLPNSQAPQSPTTGSFQQFPIIINQENSMSTPPHVVINANCPIKTNNVIDHHHHHPLLFPSSSNTQIISRYHEFPKVTTLKKCSSDTSPPPDINNQQNMSGISLTNTTNLENCPLRGAMNPNITNSIGPDDGYTWRKYGQKSVKGSEFPRSYYKCTQQNCFVKKKVERSLNGQITEIIYKGEHNHQKSQPIRRATISSKSCDLTGISKKNEGNGGSNIYRNMQFEGNKNVRALSSLKRTYSPSILTKVSDSLILNNSNINMNVFEIPETIHEPSSTLVSCDDEDEDEVRATEGIISLGDDIDDNEFEHKRRYFLFFIYHCPYILFFI
ncbi:WRKY transcription factor SUSIBA2-like [Solanum tuberosum]|uniref:WRKY transcription factor SUSIBA2-like n=1 Tax=Solanum tuberosum TaxID=4113 RepID=UPI00073A3260|nr:PREDICTED: WRKY transcription factor SUSIBA2-like [Solanum tuberosum]